MARRDYTINPIAHLSQREQRDLMATQIAIRAVMDVVVQDPLRTLLVVAGGVQHWRIQFARAMQGFKLADAGVADALYAYFSEVVIEMYGGMDAADVLDKMEVHEDRPPTEREIEEAWTVDSFSTDEGRRYFYGSDGHPMNVIKKAFSES